MKNYQQNLRRAVCLAARSAKNARLFALLLSEQASVLAAYSLVERDAPLES
jgi:hypothetical protein